MYAVSCFLKVKCDKVIRFATYLEFPLVAVTGIFNCDATSETYYRFSKRNKHAIA